MGHISYSPPVSPLPDIEVPGWMLPLASEATRYANRASGRGDLTVVIAPGTGDDAPALFIPSTAEIRVDSRMVDDPEGGMDDSLWELRNQPFMGLMDHEASHAAHTLWTPDSLAGAGCTPQMADVVAVLEELRCERRSIRERRASRKHLRAAAMDIIIRDFEVDGSTYGAAAAAALILGRRDTGVLQAADAQDARKSIAGILGKPLLADLRSLWRLFIELGDDDLPGMADVARRWLEAVGAPPDERAADALMASEDIPGQGGARPGGPMAKLAGGIAAAVDAQIVAAAAAAARTEAAEREAAEAEHRRQAQESAARLFGPSQDSDEGSRLLERRLPTSGERMAAAALAQELERAEHLDRTRAVVVRSTPPGRLMTRAAMQADAYAAVGRRDRPGMFRTVVHGTIAPAPLSIALLTDISGSMAAGARTMASLGWVMAHAGDRIGARVVEVHFGERVHGITAPGSLPDTIGTYLCDDGWEDIRGAFLAADGALGLLHGTGARLLVIASDGYFRKPVQKEYAARAMTMCRSSGVSVVWAGCTSRGVVSTYGHGTAVDLRGDPRRSAEVVGAAAVRLLQEQRRKQWQQNW